MSLEAIRYERGELTILNQLLLPHQSVYERIGNVEDGWNAIKKMKVRGAPAIAIVGCLSLAIELCNQKFSTIDDFLEFVKCKLDYLVTARPTAVNVSKSAKELILLSKQLSDSSLTLDAMKLKLMEAIEKMLEDDINDNKRLSEHGAKHILNNLHPDCNGKCSILTHCNTGSLATAGYGTALGVIRSLHARLSIDHVYCTETRPYNQGARLTAYELVHENIPATLITDSMVALLMKAKEVSAVVVGADRVARNGDTANKIGTYQIAILAKYHNVPFYVAAPVTCHCDTTHHGDDIIIEERLSHEVTSINGVAIAAEGIGCWNPSFDVTNHELITGIITEHGVFTPEEYQEMTRRRCDHAA